MTSTLLHVCVYLRCHDLLPKCFSIENIRLQEAQHWLFLNRDLCITAAITLVQANIFFLYGEIMLFLRYRFKFFTCFPKMQQIILWLWCMNRNKRVCSERRKSNFRGPRFQNFPGEDTPGPPYKCEVLCITQFRNWIRPWVVVLYFFYHMPSGEVGHENQLPWIKLTCHQTIAIYWGT
jgi:hypothetical protein